MFMVAIYAGIVFFLGTQTGDDFNGFSSIYFGGLALSGWVMALVSMVIGSG